MNYIFFEDQHSPLLEPFSLTHPVFELRCGVYTNLERVISNLKENDNLILIVRENFKDLVQYKYPAYQVNPNIIPKGIFLNSSCLWTHEVFQKANNGKIYLNDDVLISFSTNEEIPLKKLDLFFESCKEVSTNIDIKHIKFLWDTIYFNKNQLKIDFNDFSNQKFGKIHSSVIIENDEFVYIDDNVSIGAGTIIDATKGPIIISNGTKVDIGSLIQGPVYIGPNSVINPGTKLRGNIILGPVCKVGGEIENCIIQGFSNKQHDGFLGHSYLCEWVNLGANTNNSNLKNNYGNIRFNIGDEIIETKKQFLGVMIGDYSKSGISTMFNTGSYVGVGANIFGGGFQDKKISSFQWGSNDKTDLEKFIDTCKVIKSRRDQILHPSEELLLKNIYKNKK